MKTPREILFSRHRSVEPKLDAIRESVVAAACDSRTSEARSSAVIDRRYSGIGFLREIFLFRPQAWAGLAAVWVVIFALKVSTHDSSHVIANKSSVSPQVIAEVQQQKRLFAELAGLREAKDAEPPKLFLLRPRSELWNEAFAV